MSTRRGINVVVCTGCATDGDDSVLAALRAVVRDCAGAMLVSTPCLLGEDQCTTRRGCGATVMLQPCRADRSPVGPARWIGPIAHGAALAALCDVVRASSSISTGGQRSAR